MTSEQANEIFAVLAGNWGSNGNAVQRKKVWVDSLLPLGYEMGMRAARRLVATSEAAFFPPFGVYNALYDAEMQKDLRQNTPHVEPVEWTPGERAVALFEAQKMIARLAESKRMP